MFSQFTAWCGVWAVVAFAGVLVHGQIEVKHARLPDVTRTAAVVTWVGLSGLTLAGAAYDLIRAAYAWYTVGAFDVEASRFAPVMRAYAHRLADVFPQKFTTAGQYAEMWFAYGPGDDGVERMVMELNLCRELYGIRDRRCGVSKESPAGPRCLAVLRVHVSVVPTVVAHFARLLDTPGAGVAR